MQKIRLTFTRDELEEIYAGLGSRAGALRDSAAIRDQKPSEYQPHILKVITIQDRIFSAVMESDKQGKAATA